MQLTPLKPNDIHLDCPAQERQQLRAHLQMFGTKEWLIAKPGGVTQSHTIGFQPQPRVEGKPQITLELQLPAGPRFNLSDDPILVIVRIEVPDKHRRDAHEKQDKGDENKDGFEQDLHAEFDTV
jgi:hypothetical protein